MVNSSTFLKRLTKKLNSINSVSFTLLTLFIILLKSGVSPIGSEYVGWLRETAKSLPHPVTYLASSPIPMALMRLFNYPSDLTWWGLGLGVYFSWIALTTYFLVNKFPTHKKLAILLFLASTPIITTASMIGHIDVYSLIGATIAVLATFRFRFVVGALFAIGGNADQAIATSVCLVLLALAGSLMARKMVLQWCLTSLIGYLTIHSLFTISSANDPKQVMIGEMRSVFTHSLGSWDLLLYSQLGLLWIPWLLLVLQKYQNFYRRIFLLGAVIIVPFGMTFLILDGTRVGTTVGFLVLLITFTEIDNPPEVPLFIREYGLAIAYLILVFTPAIIVGNGALLRLPYRKILEQFGLIS